MLFLLDSGKAHSSGKAVGGDKIKVAVPVGRSRQPQVAKRDTPPLGEEDVLIRCPHKSKIHTKCRQFKMLLLAMPTELQKQAIDRFYTNK